MSTSRERESEIRRLYFAEHWPVGTIATQLAAHHDVVKRVLGLLARRPPAVPRPRLVDPYVELIAETLATYPRLRATRLHDMLAERGFHGSVRTLREYVATVRPVPKREAFLQLEPLKGEQAQVDWAYVGKVAVPGGERALWLFVIVLAWSRALWAEFVFDTTAHGLCRSLVRAANHFGGSPRQWLFDNAKAVVLERYGDAARFHPLLVELSGHYRTKLRLCAVRKPNQKGRVERAIRYMRDRFLAGRTIRSLEGGRRELDAFLADIAGARPHPVLAGRTVADCLVEERAALLALPEAQPATEVTAPVAVDGYANVRFDTNRYSVPPEHVGSTLTLVADDSSVRVLDGAVEVARHERCWGRRQLREIAAHRQQILDRKPQARTGAGQARLRAAAPGVDALFSRWVEDGRNVGSLIARSLKLLDLYGEPVFADAVAEAVRRATADFGALALLCEQRRASHHTPPPLPLTFGDHVSDRDVIPHNLENYDARKRRDR